ncbi:DinB family protein [Desertimonas flava]|jgi:hypothetical protein|uniref:DinB family protein n=1 Tax=Desertimonas flava TaxID=2064846 RepID=UPI000E34E68B|nr:DinB family protein [Desertimonas flava]
MPTELPADPAGAADERTTLSEFLDYQRAVMLRKAEGLTDEQARVAACPPSPMTILGLVRHLADVERSWFQRGIAGREAPPRFYGAAHPDGDNDGDFNAPPGATLDDALAALQAEIAESRAILAAASLDQLETRPERPYSVRWIVVHMIEEYARHLGHADLLREAIDGSTGD